ncbi:MAG: alpha/beta hydrolase [Actinobacteria bacterium]|nr:alpha/beta hydrolase [Actinomycetota bacterium]
MEANGLTFAALAAGPADGPLALCLHGFPDSAWTWRHLLPDLADAGFRAVAPFLRGYAPTEMPPDGLYQVGALATDAATLHEALGGDARAVLIGHDWGAITAYAAAGWQPERWRRVVTMAVPPPGAMGSGFFTYAQLRRSWYMFFFQHPLSDMAVAMDDLAFIDGLWADWSPGYDATEDLAHVKDALRDPANLAAALGYYRAMLGDGPKDARYDDAQSHADRLPPQPLLYLHGDGDGCLGPELARGAAEVLRDDAGSRFEMVEGAGHFLHVERPAEVNRLVVDFVTVSE